MQPQEVIQPPVQPYVNTLKEGSTAMLLEILLGFFGFSGFGWIYAGETATGLMWLFAVFAWNFCSIFIVALSGGVCCVATVPISIGLIVVSAVTLNNFMKSQPSRFRV